MEITSEAEIQAEREAAAIDGQLGNMLKDVEQLSIAAPEGSESRELLLAVLGDVQRVQASVTQSAVAKVKAIKDVDIEIPDLLEKVELLRLQSGGDDYLNTLLSRILYSAQAVQSAVTLPTTQNAYLLCQAESAVPEVVAQQVQTLTAQNELLNDSVQTTQQALQNTATEKERIEGELALLTQELTNTIQLVGGSENATQQVKLLAASVQRQENDKTALRNTIQELQTQINTANNNTLALRQEYNAKIDDLGQQLIGASKTREAREEEFRIFNTQVQKQIQDSQNLTKELQGQLEQRNQLLLQAEEKEGETRASLQIELQRKNQEVLRLKNTALDEEQKRNELEESLRIQNEALAQQNNVLAIRAQELAEQQLVLADKSQEDLNRQYQADQERINGLEQDKALLLTDKSTLTAKLLNAQRESQKAKELVTESSTNTSELLLKSSELEQKVIDDARELRRLAAIEKTLSARDEALRKAESDLAAANQKIKLCSSDTMTRDTTIQRLNTDMANLQARLTEAQTRLNAKSVENEQLSKLDPYNAMDEQQLLLAQQSVEVARAEATTAKFQRDAARQEAEQARNLVAELQRRLAQEDTQLKLTQSTSSIATAREQRLRDTLKNIKVFAMDTDTGIVKEQAVGSFDPQTRRILLYTPQVEYVIERSAPYRNQIQDLLVFNGKDSDRLLDIDPEWNGSYTVVAQSTLDELRRSYGKPLDPTKSGIIVSNVGSKRFGLGASVTAITQIQSLNQLGWQMRVSDLKEIASDYDVEIRFSKGNPTFATQDELRFKVTNVHIIQDPNYANGDAYYAIDLATPGQAEDITYMALGTLMMNAIYGHGSMAIRVTNKKTGQVVKSEIIRDYALAADSKRRYNTKVILSPEASNEVILYARDTGNDTYILETILIKK